ncbi:IPTL-CTERM sorting domain-containing protein [Candidatus Nitrotoga sp. M5]|uniref:IPTL-CTERM sorting domain-containing protein n=1 Tax=Candidatus Nitrotoga sp. M5 TaxID=2890409 RepID=UPI001EF1A5D6|nr:IPTL-CTERM sorting domain-containing protein [Candidatus Nitrotoga sp. M5]CAH1386882.1 OmpA-like transmembrane domain-containing protein [Candidatus Nitrotoga sp. M5]
MHNSFVNAIKTIGRVFILGACLTSAANAYEVLDNDLVRFGTGSEASVNSSGNLRQPFYFDPNIGGGSFAQLTFANFPLDNAIGIDGDGTNNWNGNGTIQENPVLTNQVLDVSGFSITSGSKGTGTIISTGTATIAGKTLTVRNIYELLPGKSFVTITTRITNTSGAGVSNLRYWVGTRDDFVGLSDSPTKHRGNLVNGVFTQLANASDQSAALKIFTATSGVLFFSTSPKANTSINGCCSFSNAYLQNPATSSIQATGDGSYALYIRMADLADGASEEFTWFYAAGEVDNLDAIAADVAAAAIVGKNLNQDTTATFSASDFVDSNSVTLEKIRIASLPAQGTLRLSGVGVVVGQEIPSANYGNLTYTPVTGFNGNDLFTFEAFINSAFQPATNVNLIVAAVSNPPPPPPDPTPVPGVVSIPTLSEWALFSLAGLMVLFGMGAVRRH